MKKTQKQSKWQYWLMLMLVLPLCYACNDEETAEFGMYPHETLGIKIAVLDKDNNETISKLTTTMPMGTYWHDDTSEGMRPKDYTLELYLDGKFVTELTNPKDQQNWLIVKEPEANGCPWWTITLPAHHAAQSMMADDTQAEPHKIEYHIQSQALFGNEDTHVIRFEYQPFSAELPHIGYYANVSFDGKKMDTYYPELYKASGERNGITLDIDSQYWMEGAVGWPVAVITLGS